MSNRIAAGFAVAVVMGLAGCAVVPERPLHFGVPLDAPKQEYATVWAENTDVASMMIAFDGMKLAPGGHFDTGPEYAAAAPPGDRMLKVHFFAAGAHSSAKIPVTLEAGHDYKVRYTIIKRDRIAFDVIDLGTGLACHYEKNGKMRHGYTPVRLVCEPAR